MAHLIACLGHDKENWKIVSKILDSGIFKTIYLITYPDCKDEFIINNKSVNLRYILIDDEPIEKLNDEIYESLKRGLQGDKLNDLEIAINISSGSGRLHSSIISSIMRLGYSIRIIDIDKDGDVVSL